MTDQKDEEALRKQAIFDSMSPRRQKHILKRGFDKWDPFQEPKDPIDIRQDKTKRTFTGVDPGISSKPCLGRLQYRICPGGI